jgi:hypothetical protein
VGEYLCRRTNDIYNRKRIGMIHYGFTKELDIPCEKDINAEDDATY